MQTVAAPFLRLSASAPSQSDAVVQSTAGPLLSVTSGLSFDGISDHASPPDPNGAVGATQFMEWINISFAVFDKATGALQFGPATGNSFWSGFGGPCESSNSGDPIAQYDKLAGRWVAMQPVFTTPFELCLAVSTTSDATGSYNRYAFAIPDNPDFPKLGVWSDAYYVSINTNPDGPSLCALDRSSMLAGAPATIQCFEMSGGIFNFLPADIDGQTPPPSGAPGIFLEPGHDSASLRLWKLHADFANPSNSTLRGPDILPVASFDQGCSPSNDGCIPQSGTTQLLGFVPGLHYRLAYRNFGSYEAMVVGQSVFLGSNTGMRWYEIRNPNSSPAVFQQGTFAPDSSFRWMGSLAMDQVGNIAMGYSVSSSTTHPSIAFTGRVPTDPLGTMESENTIIVGAASQTTNRWGDYTSMSVDPEDDCTFWYTNEYLKATGTATSTRIASFRFPSCMAVADFAVSASPSAETLTAGTSTTYTLRAAGSGGFAGTVSLSVTGLPSGATASFSPSSIAGGSGSSTLTVATSTTTPAGSFMLTITGSSGSVSHQALVALTVGSPPAATCVTAAAGDGWHNNPFPSHTGTFAAEFDATPASTGITSFIGLSNGAQTAVSGFATLVRFNSSFDIDALDGTAFAAASTIPYSAGSTYHFRLVVNLDAHAYSIFVTPPVGTELTIGNNFAFGSSQNTVTSLDSWATEQDAPPGGTTVCNFAISAGDFSLAASPSARTVPAGESTSFALSTGALAGFEGLVRLSVSGLPSGAAAAFDPPSVGAPGSSSLSLLTNPVTPAGVYTIVITGSDGLQSHTVSVTLTVVDFTVTVSPASQTVTEGSTATYTVTVTPSNGFNDTVFLSLPSLFFGMSATFNPPSIAGGSGTSTLSVTTASTPPGSYNLVFLAATDASDGAAFHRHSVSMTLVVGSPCVTASSSSGFVNTPFATQTGTFTAQYDATPSASPTNSVVAFSMGAQTAYTGLATLVRFNPSGDIDARNGGAYAAASVIPYKAGSTYHFRVVANVSSHTYSSFVTPPGGSELTIGNSFAFRTEQNTVTSLNSWAVDVSASGAGTTTVCNFAINANAAPDFALAASPGSQTVTPGSSTSFAVTVTPADGFAGAVGLSVTGLPAGATASFSPSSIAGGSGNSTLTVATTSATPSGSSTLTITGADGTLQHSTQVTLVVSSGCVAASPSTGWINTPFASQTGTFTAQYDATPSASPTNSVVAFSKGAQTAYTGFATLVRFSPAGDIDARNGGGFAAASTIPYAAGKTYHFRVVVDVATHTYSSFVTPPGGTELTIGKNFAFRTEQNAVTSLNSVGVDVNPSSSGTTTMCNFGIH